MVKSQLFTIFLNHLSLVEQGSHKYVGCGRFSVLHARPLVLFNAIKDFAISVANYAVLTAYFFDCVNRLR